MAPKVKGGGQLTHTQKEGKGGGAGAPFKPRRGLTRLMLHPLVLCDWLRMSGEGGGSAGEDARRKLGSVSLGGARPPWNLLTNRVH